MRAMVQRREPHATRAPAARPSGSSSITAASGSPLALAISTTFIGTSSWASGRSFFEKQQHNPCPEKGMESYLDEKSELDSGAHGTLGSPFMGKPAAGPRTPKEHAATSGCRQAAGPFPAETGIYERALEHQRHSPVE